MKKITKLAAAALALFSLNMKGQLANGSIAPNFTFTDINGTPHDLYTYLNQGKTVFLDISATWCGPCWEFHTGLAWDDLYQNHGPLGFPNVSPSTTNDVMVIFVEGDDQTTAADLNGTGSNTQGDWITGTLYPIINDNTAAVNAFNNDYNLAYYPTLYMICPDRMVREVDGWNTSGNVITAGSYYYNLIGSTPCPIASASLDASLKNGNQQIMLSSCDSMSPTIYLTNEGTTTLTSATIDLKVNGVTQKTITWSGSLPTYNVDAITGYKLMGAVGTNTITATVSNPNGGSDANASNNNTGYGMKNVVMSPVTTNTVAEGFQGGTFPPSNWAIVDGGSTLYKWKSANVGGFQASTKSTTMYLWDTPSGDIDDLVLQTMDLTNYATVSMTFDLAKAAISGQYDQMRVQVSTDCAKTWTTVWYKYDNATSNPLHTVMSNNDWTPSAASHWRAETINLNAYAGMSNVLVRFETISAYSNNLYIDNINLSTTMGIGSNTNVASVNIFPNPSSAEATLHLSLVKEERVNVQLVNAVGQVVMNVADETLSGGDHSYIMKTAGLPAGIYSVIITTTTGVSTQKLSVSR